MRHAKYRRKARYFRALDTRPFADIHHPRPPEADMTKSRAGKGVGKHRVVSHKAWIEARRKFLAKEKKFTRLRDALSRERRALPWEKGDKQYVFEGPGGRETLAELFDGRTQLIVYHFMFAPEWSEGCKHCSCWADNFNVALVPKERDEYGLEFTQSWGRYPDNYDQAGSPQFSHQPCRILHCH